jgi:hypothetical protein
MIENIELWLKGTIPGIIILGAIGSLFAVGITRFALYLINKILPLPYRIYRRNSIKQAFFLGAIYFTISKDDTARSLISFLAFHFLLFFVSSALFIIFIFISTFIFASQSTIAFNIAIFASMTSAFLALYWCYHESRYIHLTYLSFWKSRLEHAEEGYKKMEEEDKQKDIDQAQAKKA